MKTVGYEDSSVSATDLTDWLLLRRSRVALGLLAVVVAVVGVVDYWVATELQSTLPIASLVPLIWATGAWLWLARPRRTDVVLRVMTASASGMILCAVALAELRGRFALLGLVDAGICLALASFLPVGWRAQLIPATTAVISLTFVRIIRAPTALSDAVFWTAVGAIMVSVYLAFDVRTRHGRAAKHARELLETEESIRRLNNELDQRVEQRTAAMTVATRKLEDVSEGLWNDLREPLSRAAKAYASLRRGSARNWGDESRAMLDRGEAAVRSMETVLDELHSFVRLVNRPLHKESFDLSAAFEDELVAKRRADPERNLRAVVAPGAIVRADAVMLEEVVRQLVDNAWTFTRGRDVAIIEFGVVSLLPGRSTFFVRDNGIGFDPRHMSHLFRPLQRLPGSENFPGRGVGLARAHRTMFCHDGGMWAQAEPGSGATVFFYLGD